MMVIFIANETLYCVSLAMAKKKAVFTVTCASVFIHTET